jgi:hypothetical protein
MNLTGPMLTQTLQRAARTLGMLVGAAVVSAALLLAALGPVALVSVMLGILWRVAWLSFTLGAGH